MLDEDNKLDDNIDQSIFNNDSNEQKQHVEKNTSNEGKIPHSNVEEQSVNQLIHKKNGRLHIYVRQDKYKGELKSKNWVGRLYINGKQKISSSGTKNLDEAIPILEKWYDNQINEAKEKEQIVNKDENLEKKEVSDVQLFSEEQNKSQEREADSENIQLKIESDKGLEKGLKSTMFEKLKPNLLPKSINEASISNDSFSVKPCLIIR